MDNRFTLHTVNFSKNFPTPRDVVPDESELDFRFSFDQIHIGGMLADGTYISQDFKLDGSEKVPERIDQAIQSLINVCALHMYSSIWGATHKGEDDE